MDKRVLDGRSLGASAPRFWSRRRVDRVRERGSGRESGRAGWGRGGRERGRMRGIVWVLLCAACSGANGQQVRPLPPSILSSRSPAHNLCRSCRTPAGVRSVSAGRSRPGVAAANPAQTHSPQRSLAARYSLSLSRALARSLGSCLTQRLLGARRVAGTPTAR